MAPNFLERQLKKIKQKPVWQLFIIVISPTIPFALGVFFGQFEHTRLSNSYWHQSAIYTATPLSTILFILIFALCTRNVACIILFPTLVFLIICGFFIVPIRDKILDVQKSPGSSADRIIENLNETWFWLFVLFLVLASILVALLAVFATSRRKV